MELSGAFFEIMIRSVQVLKKYDKLVRDRIPEIIEKSGKSCHWCRLDDERYLKMLDAKPSKIYCPIHLNGLRKCR